MYVKIIKVTVTSKLTYSLKKIYAQMDLIYQVTLTSKHPDVFNMVKKINYFKLHGFLNNFIIYYKNIFLHKHVKR